VRTVSVFPPSPARPSILMLESMMSRLERMSLTDARRGPLVAEIRKLEDAIITAEPI
jgi:hypothetical protein